MGLFQRVERTRNFIFSVVALLIVTCIFYFFYQNPKSMKHTTGEMSDEQHYYYRWIRINYYLHTLSRECRTGNMTTARNTVEDLMQEWAYQDMLAGSCGNEAVARYHFPSDSLGNLGTLISKSRSDMHYRQVDKQIVMELKRITDRLDSMFLRIDRIRKKEYQYAF